MMTLEQRIAVAWIAGPLIAKVYSDWMANRTLTHNAKMDRIVGMAGREVATIYHALTAMANDPNVQRTEHALLTRSVNVIMTRMGDSVADVGADSDVISGILQGELDKLRAAPPTILPPAVETKP